MSSTWRETIAEPAQWGLALGVVLGGTLGFLVTTTIGWAIQGQIITVTQLAACLTGALVVSVPLLTGLVLLGGRRVGPR